jgi:hypothetical protein
MVRLVTMKREAAEERDIGTELSCAAEDFGGNAEHAVLLVMGTDMGGDKPDADDCGHCWSLRFM